MRVLPYVAVNPLNNRRLALVVMAATDAHSQPWLEPSLDSELAMLMRSSARHGDGVSHDGQIMRMHDCDSEMLNALSTRDEDTDNETLGDHDDVCAHAMVCFYFLYLIPEM